MFSRTLHDLVKSNPYDAMLRPQDRPFLCPRPSHVRLRFSYPAPVYGHISSTKLVYLRPQLALDLAAKRLYVSHHMCPPTYCFDDGPDLSPRESLARK
jgi:hypothetical protein